MILPKPAVIVAALTSLTFLPACKSDRPRVENTGERVRRETAEAWAAVKAYGYDRKHEYRQRVEQLAMDLDRELDDWRHSVRTETPEAKEEWNKLLKTLRQKQDTFRTSFENVEAASESNWEDVKRKTSAAVEDLQEAFARAAARFS